jgi:hypothetical protein
MTSLMACLMACLHIHRYRTRPDVARHFGLHAPERTRRKKEEIAAEAAAREAHSQYAEGFFSPAAIAARFACSRLRMRRATLGAKGCQRRLGCERRRRRQLGGGWRHRGCWWRRLSVEVVERLGE